MNYSQHLGLADNIQEWLLANPQPKNLTTTQYEHVLDFINCKKFTETGWFSWKLLLKKTDKWDKMLQQNGRLIDEQSGEDTETILSCNDGFKWVRLISENSYKREGALMRHCVSSYYGKDKTIYSLRDEFNNPHCTIEKDIQIKGKGNGDISPKYIHKVVDFLEWTGMEVRDREMNNLGYKKCVYSEYLKDNSSLFRDIYIPMGVKMELKKGYIFIDNKDTLIAYKGKCKIIFDGNLRLTDCTKSHDFSRLLVITGDLCMYRSKTSHNFSGLTTVGGRLNLRLAKAFHNLSSLVTVGDDLDLYGSMEAHDFSSLITVEGSLNIGNSKSSHNFSSLVTVGNWLELSYAESSHDFSSLVTVGGNLSLFQSKVSHNFSNLTTVGGYLDLRACKQSHSFSSLVTVKGGAHYERTTNHYCPKLKNYSYH